MITENHTDVLVAGNGLAGMIAALALAGTGAGVVIVGPKPAKPDRRTTALMMPSIKMLEHIGVWDEVRPHAAPLATMRILDGTKRLVRARPVTFHAAEITEPAFGWNIPNAFLGEALAAAIKANSQITYHDTTVTHYKTSTETVPLAPGIDKNSIQVVLGNDTTIRCDLVVAADGRSSMARDAAGIKTTAWSYPQCALVTTFSHSRPHDNCSSEFHTETGPFTIVPLSGRRSSLVWVLKPEIAVGYIALEGAALSILIEAKMQSILGKIELSNDRQLYPLAGHYPSRFAQNHIALIGEAAHLFPPIGAQGLNLGIRDVEDLCAVISPSDAKLGSDAQLAAYDTKRRPDIMARTGAVDALNRSLLSAFLPIQLVRSLGLATLDIMPPLRGFFMREGMRPGSGFTDLFSRFKKSANG